MGSQLWTFLVEYVRSAAERGLRPSDVLSLLLRLGFCEPGVCYDGEHLSDEETKLLLDFAGLGLLCLPGRMSPSAVRTALGHSAALAFQASSYGPWAF